MAVPVYQIQNILTLYCRKLEETWHNDKKQVPALGWKINVIAQSKKEMVINKVTESILSKITLMGPRRYMEQHAHPEFTITPCKSLSQGSPAENRLFSFSILNEENIRIKKTMELGTGQEYPVSPSLTADSAQTDSKTSAKAWAEHGPGLIL